MAQRGRLFLHFLGRWLGGGGIGEDRECKTEEVLPMPAPAHMLRKFAFREGQVVGRGFLLPACPPGVVHG